ncbi:DUF1846 domain-containing protein [Proteiniclasticum sp. QWL-01]|uniref:DUF1846 domain-containing protein n=1 Tax=Proteiniclasticum sp. QWL-01 TaxID=3036945 RepID=UPI00240F3E8B|nr:DUF1846 domain-containing protein [Proteiniclasticum sp. QWL-01]WFF72509.1 DUF1846 domain-containing protein [Proteiniclasticum sp. QWL-01]
MKVGFDSKKYLEEQSKFILERVHNYDKLYLEFGGKLFNDMHAKRVLPGFDANAKVELLRRLKDQIEVIICMYAGDIERNKINENLGITYDMEVMKLIDDLKSHGIPVNSVVLTRYADQPAAKIFVNKLDRRGIKVFIHRAIAGYPSDIDTVVSEAGYGINPYIETEKPIVVVTAPGPGNGKLATCLSQLYHEAQRGLIAGYSKFETFPVWDLPLKHPVNVAYESATVDLKDLNMIDFYHMETYGKMAVNYNRDIETFPILKRILEKITGRESDFQSPTDMGVNCISTGIFDDEAVSWAANQEIIRRYFKALVDYKKGRVDLESFERSRMLMEKMGLAEADRLVVPAARSLAATMTGSDVENVSVVALELADGTIITGKRKSMMQATAACVLNALKYLAGITDNIYLLSPVVLKPIGELKRKTSHLQEQLLDLNEILIALSMSAATNPSAQAAFACIDQLDGTNLHSTTILNTNDEKTLRALGIDYTSDDDYATDKLFYGN